jgi:hypothetical protein
LSVAVASHIYNPKQPDTNQPPSSLILQPPPPPYKLQPTIGIAPLLTPLQPKTTNPKTLALYIHLFSKTLDCFFCHEFFWITIGIGPALGTPPAQQLNRNTFLLWRALVIPAFRGANVMALLQGTDIAPAKTVEAQDSAKNKVQVETLLMLLGLLVTNWCIGFFSTRCHLRSRRTFLM